jgi:hypothetical protein
MRLETRTGQRGPEGSEVAPFALIVAGDDCTRLVAGVVGPHDRAAIAPPSLSLTVYIAVNVEFGARNWQRDPGAEAGKAGRFTAARVRHGKE